jgi:hypothetical protein
VGDSIGVAAGELGVVEGAGGDIVTGAELTAAALAGDAARTPVGVRPSLSSAIDPGGVVASTSVEANALVCSSAAMPSPVACPSAVRNSSAV